MKIEDPVKEILMRYWDPCAVSDVPEAQDEYDGYALQLTGMLYRGTNENQIIEYLEKVVVDKIGLSSNLEVSRSVAKKLLSLKLPPVKRK